MRKLAENRIIIVLLGFMTFFILIALNYYRLADEQKYVETAVENSFITINAGDSQGTIFDRNMKPLTNAGTEYVAVAVPSAIDYDKTIELASDPEKFSEDFQEGQPFTFGCKSDAEESAGLTIFEIPVRYSEKQSARHIIGYLSEGHGADGIEYAYDSVLRSSSSENSVTYSTDGFGHILIGDGKSVVRSTKQKTGAVTSIDADMQKICEEYGKNIEKGAIVLSDVNTGDILALSSFPDYSPDDLQSALNDENLPLINRNLYSYSVGSVFKLVTACEAIIENQEKYIYDCKGTVNILTQTFNCHKLDGHGIQDMTAAMTNSCNTYFIKLSERLDINKFRNLAFSLGFGREIRLCSGIEASAGVLPTVQDLDIPAELANFSFGQGKLSATPLQINQLTCTIANGGELPQLRLIKGITTDGKTVGNEKKPQKSRVIPEETAHQLRDMMTAAVNDSKNSNAKSKYVRIAAKTSTAQTGQFDKNGIELCHAWITGFFPADNPRYALTILIENGGYGNDTAAPIFKNIAEELTATINYK